MSRSYTRGFEEVLAAERECIAAQRKVRGVSEDPVKIVGLALSGGGMRSSGFALGVLQALDRFGVLRRIDYLSSVSGGGYIGAALTWFRRDGETRFPFGLRGQGIRGSEEEPSRILGFLRQHGDDLTPAGGADSRAEGGEGGNRGAEARTAVPPMAYLGLVTRSVFLSSFVYGSILVGVFFALDFLDRFVTLAAPILAALYPTPSWITIVSNLNFALLVGVALLAMLGLAWVAHPIGAFVMRRWRRDRPADEREGNRTYSVGLWAQRWTGRALGATLVAGTLGSVPIVADWLGRWLPDRWSLGVAAAAAIALGASLGVSIFYREGRRRSQATPARRASLLERASDASSALLLLYGLLLFSHVLAVGLVNSGAVFFGLAVVAVAVASGLLADLNQLSISRMYRDRLMEAFLPGKRAIDRNQWQPAFDANVARLESMSGPETPGPYPLINTNLVTLGSRRTRYRGRGGDSFVLSPLYSGSDATGWRRTRDWMEGRLTLATAMAISGTTERKPVAEGRGPSRNRLVSAAMFALGLRLGFWAQNPSLENGRGAPNYLAPGLMRGALGRDPDERGRFIELSDGGEFDALGLYELIRRRAEVIVVADASEDAHFGFSGLANAVARVRIDFGVDIEFSDPEFDLEGLVPVEAEGGGPKLAKRGFAVGTIRYPEADGSLKRWGVLLYLKATMVPGVPPDVRGYGGVHADFPHESTAGPSFSEDRVEAYRGLGYCIAKELLEENDRRRKVVARVDPLNGLRSGRWLESKES